MSVAVEERPRLWRAAGAWRGVGTAIGIFALTRVAQLIILGWLDAASDDPIGIRNRLLVWDAGWFLKVAVNGYPHGYTYDMAGQLQGNELAFFPVYPLLIRAVAAVGIPASTAALIVSWVASVAMAIALHLLGTSLYDKRVGWALVAICCSAPVSIVFSMAYSEAVFLALVAGMLVAAHRKVWWAAGLLGVLTALSRPTGAAAAVALAVAALLAVRADRKQAWKPLLAAAVALAGVPLFLAWVGWRVGDPAAWFRIQAAGWGTAFDYGASTVTFLATTLSTGDGWVPISVALILLAAVAAAWVALAGKPWPPLAVYGLIAMVLVYGQAGFYHSKPRLLVPVLLTLLPAAIAASRARPRVAILSITAWAAFGLWYGAYLVAVWPYTL
ncbi:mannosyltransferase family protein [Actinoplanes sp. CA-131856]